MSAPLGVLMAVFAWHPLAVLVTLDGNGLVANHIPMETGAEAGALGTLRGHVARANPVWRSGAARDGGAGTGARLTAISRGARDTR
jgi:transcriptional regulator